MSSSSVLAPQGALRYGEFDPAHLPLLTLVAACALQCSQYRSTEECLDALFAAPVEVAPSAPTDGPTATDAEPRTATLSGLYAEVRVLECVHHIRSLLRKLQECPAHAAPGLLELVEKHLAGLYQTIPDPLFGALAKTTHAQLRDADGHARGPEERHLLETQTLQVVEKLQREVLSQSRRLTTRCTSITLRYRNHAPF